MKTLISSLCLLALAACGGQYTEEDQFAEEMQAVLSPEQIDACIQLHDRWLNAGNRIEAARVFMRCRAANNDPGAADRLFGTAVAAAPEKKDAAPSFCTADKPCDSRTTTASKDDTRPIK